MNDVPGLSATPLAADLDRVATSGFTAPDTITVTRRVALAAAVGDGDLADSYDAALVRWAAQFPTVCDRPGFDTAWWDLPGLPRVLATHARAGGGLTIAWRRLAASTDVEAANRRRWLAARAADHPAPWLSLRHLAVM